MKNALAAAVLVAALAVCGLAFFPPFVLILLFLFGPAGAAFLFAGRPLSLDTFVANGFVASVVSGLAGAVWLGANADEGDATAAIVVGAFVSFLILSFMGEAGCFVVAKFLGRAKRIESEDAEVDDE